MKQAGMIASNLALHRLLVYLSLAFSVHILQAQPSPFFLHHLGIQDGLTTQNYNYFLHQDSFGTMWISSDVGMNRFDGHQVRKFLASDPLSGDMWDNNIQSSMFEDRSGNLWYSTVSGINKYDRNIDRMQRIQLKITEDLREKTPYILFLDQQEDRIFFRIDSLLFQASLGDTLSANRIPGVPVSGIFCANQTDSSITELWTLHRNNLYRTRFFHSEISARDSFQLPPTEETGRLTSLTCLDNGEVYLGCINGLLAVAPDLSESRWLFRAGDNDIEYIRDIVEVNADYILIGCDKHGLFWLNRDESAQVEPFLWQSIDQTSTFNKGIHRLFRDEDGLIWISTDGYGVYFFHPEKRSVYSPVGLERHGTQAGTSIRILKEDVLGRIWAFSEEKVMILDQDLQILKGLTDLMNQKMASQGIDRAIYDVAIDKQGGILLCTRMDAFYLSHPDSLFVKVRHPWQVRSISCISASCLPQGEVWVGVQGRGMARLMTSGIGSPYLQELETTPPAPFYLEAQSLPSGAVLISEADNRLIYSPPSSGSIDIHCRGAIRGLSMSPVNQQIWIASEFDLFILHEQTDSTYLERIDILGLNDILSLTHDHSGSLWIGCAKGIFQVDPDTRQILRKLNMSDGVNSAELNPGAIMRSSRGLILAGGSHGISVISPASTFFRPVLPQTIISRLLVNDQDPSLLWDEQGNRASLFAGRPLLFEPDQRNLTFFFAGQDFSNPAGTEYKYRLVPVEQDPIYRGRNHQVRYPDLRPGQYSLEVWSTNSDGQWQELPTRLFFRIKAPWYQTPLAIAAYVALILLSGGLFIRDRAQKARKKAQQLEKDLELERVKNALLRQQMNPHFLKNALSVVQSRMKDDEKSRNILRHLGAIVKALFNSSELETIPIGQEIKELEEYLALENELRQFRISHHISTPEDPDFGNVMVPPMILQPVAENAIKHGFSDEQEEWNLEFSFELTEEHLLIEIKDNGTGIGEHGPTLPQDRPSATRILQSRLRSFGGHYELSNRTDQQGAVVRIQIEA